MLAGYDFGMLWAVVLRKDLSTKQTKNQTKGLHTICARWSHRCSSLSIEHPIGDRIFVNVDGRMNQLFKKRYPLAAEIYDALRECDSGAWMVDNVWDDGCALQDEIKIDGEFNLAEFEGELRKRGIFRQPGLPMFEGSTIE